MGMSIGNKILLETNIKKKYYSILKTNQLNINLIILSSQTYQVDENMFYLFL